MQVSITGIKPTGTPHLGNYLGMIRPALSLAERTEALYFVADYHAMTTTRDPDRASGADARGRRDLARARASTPSGRCSTASRIFPRSASWCGSCPVSRRRVC